MQNMTGRNMGSSGPGDTGMGMGPLPVQAMLAALAGMKASQAATAAAAPPAAAMPASSANSTQAQAGRDAADGEAEASDALRCGPDAESAGSMGSFESLEITAQPQDTTMHTPLQELNGSMSSSRSPEASDELYRMLGKMVFQMMS